MENPPDLIVVITSDDQCQEKKKIFIENIPQEQHNDFVANLQSDKYALECELQQLRAQLVIRNNNEFDEQSHLLQQRFHDEIQSVNSRHMELVHHVTNDVSTYVTDVLRKSIANIESLRLLHHKELGTHSIAINNCIQHQSFEMLELFNHLIHQQRTTPMNFFGILINNFQTELNNLQMSFDSKINYLTEIHSLTIDKLKAKHDAEIEEMKCELYLKCNQRS